LGVNKKVWDKLPKDLQEKVQQCALQAAQYERGLIQKADAELVAELTKKGMKVNEVDVQPFKAIVQPVYEKYKPVFGQEIMDLIGKYSK
jgi:TRAP-type C4-dicarboxylate transport system substrate-binding protein